MVGAKNGEGVYQRLICWMGPHDLYVEPFAGTGAIFRKKRLAPRSILIDSDPARIAELREIIGARWSHGIPPAETWPGDICPVVETIVGDGREFLRGFHPAPDVRVQVYCDPPYLRGTRRDPNADYYREEWSEADHRDLLDILAAAHWPALVSGYPSELYDHRLAGWHGEKFRTQSRAGPAVEQLWANYPQPDSLHDYRYVGADYKARWRIHKRQRRWVRLLCQMPDLERRAMLAYLRETFRDEFEDPTATGGDGDPC